MLFARIPPPPFLVRYFIVGSSASDAVVEALREVIASVPAELLASRARSALSIDVTSALARCTSPLLYLRGTQDKLVRERSVEAVVEAAAEPVFVAYIKAPHLLLKTSPREAWRAISEFLAGATVS
jgi:fermentation-respiration switch protein FrsA (DUF1100 family)